MVKCPSDRRGASPPTLTLVNLFRTMTLLAHDRSYSMNS